MSECTLVPRNGRLTVENDPNQAIPRKSTAHDPHGARHVSETGPDAPGHASASLHDSSAAGERLRAGPRAPRPHARVARHSRPHAAVEAVEGATAAASSMTASMGPAEAVHGARAVAVRVSAASNAAEAAGGAVVTAAVAARTAAQGRRGSS